MSPGATVRVPHHLVRRGRAVGDEEAVVGVEDARRVALGLAATGPVWSSSWPSSSTALQTSARSMFSPKNWWNIWPTGLFRNATPPEWPGQCHEYEPSSRVVDQRRKNGGASAVEVGLAPRG